MVMGIHTNYEIEGQLQPLLNAIDESNKLTWKKVICLLGAALREEGEMRPMTTVVKAIVSLVGLSAIFPNVIGSLACLKTLEVIPLSDMESTDRETAMGAVQGIGNVGMTVTYITQLEEFLFHPMVLMIKKPYYKKVCEEIRAVYSRALLENRLSISPDAIDFLIERENKELAHYQGLPVSDTVQFDEIQDQLDSELEQKLSAKNIIVLTIGQSLEDMGNSSGIEKIAKVSGSILLLGLAGVSCSLLAVSTYGCFKAFDVQNFEELASTDSEEVGNAIANYANTGHGLEYIAVSGILGFKALQTIFGHSYKKVMCRQIEEVYRPHLQAKQSQNESELLYRRMKQELSKFK